jgi:hypothetical protein
MHRCRAAAAFALCAGTPSILAAGIRAPVENPAAVASGGPHRPARPGLTGYDVARMDASATPLPPQVPPSTHRAAPAWRAALLYAAFTIVLAFPLVRHPASSVMPGDPDTDLFMWTFAWNTHALVSDPAGVFDANIYYPHRRTLAFSENLIGSTIFAAPVLWATGDHILALNVVALLSIVLSGVGAYVLAGRLGAGTAAALVCGAVFAFSPARFYRLGQLHLTTIQWIPFCLAYVHAYLDSGRRRDLRIAVAFFTLQALSSGHGVSFLFVSLAVLLLYRFTLGEPFHAGRRLRDLGLPGLLLLVPVVLIFVPYRQVQVDMGLRRTLENWQTAPESFIASPTSLHTALLSWVTDVNPGDTATAYLFPGCLALALAGTAIVWRIAGGPAREAVPGAGSRFLRRDVTLAYGGLAVVATLLTAGPPLGLWPYVYWLPGFNFIRVPSRFFLVAVLALAVLAAAGFERITALLVRRQRLAAAVAAILVIVLECLTVPLPGYRRYAVDIPEADRWIATRPKPSVVAEFPVKPSERLQSTYMLHSMAHWQRTIHGHSGLRTPLHEELYDTLRGFPDEASLAALARLRVSYLIVHGGIYTAEEWPTVEERLARYAGRLRLVHERGADRVYVLRDLSP